MFWTVFWFLVAVCGWALVWWFATRLADAHSRIDELKWKADSLGDRLDYARAMIVKLAQKLTRNAASLRQARYDAEIQRELAGKLQAENGNLSDEVAELRADYDAALAVIGQLQGERKARLIVVPPTKLH